MDNMSSWFPRRPRYAAAALLTAMLALSSCTAATDSQHPQGASKTTSAGSTQPDAAGADDNPQYLRAEVVARHPFDEASFTQGLEVDQRGHLLVSTGQTGQSRIYRRDMDGRELQSADLDREFFGEGITRVGPTIWQLTWRDHVAVRRDAETLEETGRVSWPGEGWGICALTDQLLVASDGSPQVRLLDAATLREVSRTTVGGTTPIAGLNELECVNGEVYANVFLTDQIVGFDPHSGRVLAHIDASGLPNNAKPDVDNVLNGIAHLPGTDRFLLAGKRWPDLYEVTFVPR